MLVYVDETGDTGFKFADNSSRYFVIALVVFAGQEQADSTSQQIDALRHELRTPNIEFHFAKNKRSTRQAFLTRMRQAEFTAFALVVDKQKLSPANLPDRAAFYQAVCGVAFEKASYLFREADIYFDEGGGEKFQKKLASHLRRKINRSGEGRIGKVKTLKSAGSSLIQLADMICGAVFRAVESGESQYRDIIQPRLDAVLQWPE